MPPKRRPKPFEKGTTSTNRNNGFNKRSSSANALAKQKPPSSPGFSKSFANWRRPKNVSNSDYKSRIETLWKTMGTSRVTERQNAIKNGLMADPNKRTTLADAIRVVGTCQDMCPEFERIQRIRENAVDRAEKVTLQGGAKVVDEARMVKAFHRPDAGKEEQLPSDLRPPAALHTTVRYLLDNVASPVSSLAEHHKFVWDRTRCIRNDFTIQASSRLEDVKIAIQCYEEIARFHILSLHQMPKIGKHDYDAQQELEQLSATLLTLFEFYDDNNERYEAPHEAEFRAYKILIDIRSRTNDTLERVQTWPSRIRDSNQVQTAVQLCQASGIVRTDTSTMLSPYARSVQVNASRYARFWSILDSPKVDYLMACAASVSFNEIRARSLETMARVYRSGPTSRLHDISLDDLTFSLGLDSNSQTRTLFRKSGLTISKQASGVAYLDVSGLSGRFPKSSVASVDQMFSRSIVEVKRQDRIFSAIYKGLDIGYCRENGLIEESEGEAEFEPNAEDLDSEDQHEESLFVDGQGDEDMDQGSSEISKTVANPFASAVPSNNVFKPGPSVFPKVSTPFSSSDFGQPSVLQAPAQTSAKPIGLFAASNPAAPSVTSTNPFSQFNMPSTTPKTMNMGSTSFGQPSSLAPKTIEPTKPFAVPSASTDSTAISGINGTSIFATKSPAEAASAGIFSWKPPATPQPGLFTSQATSALSAIPDQAAKQPSTDTSNTGSENLVPAKKPLFPFVNPGPVNISTENISITATPQTSQPPVSTTISEPKSSESTPILPSANAAGPAFSTLQSNNQTQSAFFPTQLQSTTVHTPLDIGSPINKTSSQIPSNIPPLFTQPVAPSVSASDLGPPMNSPVSSISKDSTPLIPPRPVITQEQRKIALDVIAKDLFLGEYGILEQFIEANLGPIYDKAQRKVTKERRRARLDEIKTSLLYSKFLPLWKWRVEERLQRKRAIRRRERMRQSRHESLTATPSEDEVDVSTHRGQTGYQISDQLKHLTRGFHETFDKSISSDDGALLRERSISNLPDKGYKLDIPSNNDRSKVPEGHSQSARRYRHSHSQSVDGSSRVSLLRPSSSMPPPDKPSRSRLLVQNRASLLKPFVGSGFLQDEALRKEAINLARRTGPVTTTESDYFRLKARNIDPNTGLIPSTRKRGRDFEDTGHDRSLSKSRRLSTSTVSSVALSPSLLQFSTKTKSSETEAPLTNGQSQAAAPKYTDEEDELFAAARKLRETLAEDTQWMRTMREEHEKEEANLKAETPAQRRLREFKMTPSKTSIRLRQTYANGLLPPDHFDKQSTERDKAKGAATAAENLSLDTPTPKMGLAALPKDRHKRHHDNGSTMALASRGASVDDAIEL